MKRFVVRAALVAAVLLTLPSMTTYSRAADGQTAAPAATAVRSAKEISQELRALYAELQKGGPTPGFYALATKEDRTRYTERMRDPFLKLAALMDEYSQADIGQTTSTPPGGMKVTLQGQRITFLAMASGLGADFATKQLAMLAASTDKETAISGKIGQQLVAWLQADKDAAAEGKILDGIEALAKENPTSNALAINLRTLRSPLLPNEVAHRIDEIYLKTLSGPVAEGMQAMIDSGAKQRNAVGKPFVLAGKTNEGKEFSTKEYAGKVVLIDFWATWCGPCKAELPRVKEIYAKYHEKGLEIVGVSCDGSGEALEKYTKENGMPWVELWDKATQDGKPTAWHALATEWKVDGIPQMFLIDRQGVLRTVQARAEMEKLIPELIDEKPPTK